ncbi:MaoC family dehydratase N-terminal domain-containing protein [Aeromicrobium sp. CTD01-1L150]|uniref:MaoC family dehydratase N-terminal domain-containing protein n=1 Tax=Aeromicrobium sp. CTD01-1L150 TaxID=3341830 RepID=UPI0035C01803
MPIDTAKAKALTLPAHETTIERGRIRFFAQSIGETDPVYMDVEAAHAAGHTDLLVPPTFFFSLELESTDPFAYLSALGVDLRRVLHGEQTFTYATTLYAGDTVHVRPAITDVFDKQGGALEFICKETVYTRSDELIARATSTFIVRNPEVPR